MTVDHASVKAALMSRQIKDSKQYNRSHRVKSHRVLVLGERCWGTGTNNEWKDCFITVIDKKNRCYQVVFEDTGRSLRRTRSHLRPRGPDTPHISEIYRQQYANPVLSGGEESKSRIESNLVLSGPTERDTAVDFISDSEERTVNFPENPISDTRRIPPRLHDRQPEQRPPPAMLPIDLMLPVTDNVPRPEPPERQEEDHDNVPDTGSNAESSAANDSGTSESSPGFSSTMGTNETTDTASTETSGSSSSSSDSSTELDSAPSTPLSPRRTSSPCTEEAMTAKVSSRPTSPSLADSSLEMSKYYEIKLDMPSHIQSIKRRPTKPSKGQLY